MATEKTQITGLKKRQQIQKANKTMFLWVMAASVAITILLVLAQFLIRQLMFNQKVISMKGETNATLVQNKKTFDEGEVNIKSEVNKLVSDPNLTALRVSDTDTALQVIVDALPTSDDRAALATSLQQVVLARSGVSIESISVTDSNTVATDTVTTETGDGAGAGEINFNMVLVGNYGQLNQAVQDIERTIRPIVIDRMQLEGTGAQLRLAMQAKTFYLPAKTMELKTEAIKP